MKKAVFLDRDGVINAAFVVEGKPVPPRTLLDLHILPGVDIALKNLQAAGWLLIVVTNQPDVARGKVTQASVEEINTKLSQILPLSDFRVCYHDSDDHCECRKPLPGAILAASRDYVIDLKCSYMIGDRWRDIEAGKNAGCMTIFIDYGYIEKQPKSPDHKVTSLLEASKLILGENNENCR